MGQAARFLPRTIRLAVAAGVVALLPAMASAQQGSAPADAVAELKTSVAEMSRLMASGRRTEAVALAEAVEQRLSAALGREHVLVAAALYNLGQAYKAAVRPQDAAAALERALAIETKASAPGAQSYRRTLHALARLERDRGRPARSIELYTSAIAALPDAPSGEAALARAEFAEEAGQLLRHMGSYPGAEAMLREALATRVLAHGPDDGSLAGTLNMLAGIYRVQGKHAEAETHYQRAIAIAAATKGPRDANTAILMDNLAVLYQQTGRLVEAEALQRRALTIFDEVLGLDHPTSAQAAANLAANFQSQARHGEALALYERVLEVYLKKLPENDARLGVVFDNIAGVLRGMGRLDSAMGFYHRALATLEKAYPPEHPEIGVALNNLSVVHSTLGRFAEAESFAQRALKIAHATHGDAHPGVAISLGNLADALAGLGRIAEARAALERAIGIVEGMLGNEHPMLVLPLHQLASMLLAEGRIAEALGPARRAVTIENAARSRERQLRPDRQERSRSKGEALAKLLDALWRSGEKEPALRDAAARESFEALQSGAASQAGIAIQQLGARLGAAKPELAALVRDRQDLAAQWADADKALGAAVARRAIDRKPEQEAGLRTRLAELDSRLASVDRRMAGEFPAYRELSQQSPLAADAAMELLRAGEALIAYRVEERDVYAWVLSDGRIAWHRMPIPARQLADKVLALRCGLDAGEWGDAKRAARCQSLAGKSPEAGLLPFRASIAAELYQTLIGPLQAQITGKHLLIAATGSLTSLPFGVLISQTTSDGGLKGAGWLGVDNAITTLPTVASLRTLRRDARPTAARKPYLGIGNPLLEGPTGDASLAFAAQSCIAPRPGRPKAPVQTAASSPLPSYYLRSGAASTAELRQLSPLPETRDEICSVAAKLGAGEDDLLLGSRASERQLRELNASAGLASYRVVHFATHGLVAGEIGGLAEPALVLTPPAEAAADNDGLLTASEVAALGLDADWVIMSACNTAAGEKLGAEALSGLARSFFYAGARALLVSHWPVQSSAAVKLTTGALAELQADPLLGRAEALRRAMVALIGDTSEEGNWHPQVWAPFVVVGEGGGGVAAAASAQNGPSATANEKAGVAAGGSIVPPVTATEPAPAGVPVARPAGSRAASRAAAQKSAAGAMIRKETKEKLPWAQPGGTPAASTKQPDQRPAKPSQKLDPASVFRPY